MTVVSRFNPDGSSTQETHDESPLEQMRRVTDEIQSEVAEFDQALG